MPTKAKVGVVLFGVFVLTAIIGPLVTPYDPSYQNPSPAASMNAPSAAHLALPRQASAGASDDPGRAVGQPGVGGTTRFRTVLRSG
jgi:hypothetical protein